MPTVTIPAYAASVLDETLTLHAPAVWHERITALSERTCYGPDFSRRVVTHLIDMSDTVRSGYSALAYDHLLAAEAAAARKVSR